MTNYRKANPIYKDSRWLRLRNRVYAEETHCWLCGREVDKQLPSTHPMSKAAEHVVSLAKGGNPFDRGNVRLAHKTCNSTKGSKDYAPDKIIKTSDSW